MNRAEDRADRWIQYLLASQERRQDRYPGLAKVWPEEGFPRPKEVGHVDLPFPFLRVMR